MIGRTWHGYMSVEPIGAGRIVAGLAVFAAAIRRIGGAAHRRMNKNCNSRVDSRDNTEASHNAQGAERFQSFRSGG